MIRIGQRVCVHGHTKELICIVAYGHIFKSASKNSYTAQNIMKLAFIFQLHRKVFPIENCTNIINNVLTSSQRRIKIHYSLLIEVLLVSKLLVVFYKMHHN